MRLKHLLTLVGDEMDTQGELVNSGLLLAKIKDANLSIGNTSVEA
jgi:hypothetical protein